jgi:hypothetical protein
MNVKENRFVETQIKAILFNNEFHGGTKNRKAGE